MTALARLILMFSANLAAVLIAAFFVPEFIITPDIQNLMPLVVALTLANTILRPILKMILSPLIFATLGLFTVIINVAILYLIDIFSESLTINGLSGLFYATSIISLVNIIIHYSALFVYRRPELG